jgi:hypothetical protein
VCSSDLPKFNVPLEKKLHLNRKAYLRIIGDLMKAFTDKWGDEAWEVARGVAYKIGVERTEGLKRRMQIDPTDVRSLYRVFRLEEDIFLTDDAAKAKLVELSEKRLNEHFYECTNAEACKRCPDMCNKFFRYIDIGTFDALGVKVKRFDVPRSFWKGDPFEETVLEIE